MKKILAVFVIIPFILVNTLMLSTSEAQVEKIPSETTAKEIASKAGGEYIKTSTAPALSGNQVALPVVDEASGKIIGYVVAEKEALIAALNSMGYTEVAGALAAIEAGTAGGLAVGSGLAMGTTTLVVLGSAGLIALVVGVSGSGGGDGGGGALPTTSHHP